MTLLWLASAAEFSPRAIIQLMIKVIYFDYHGVLDRHYYRGMLERIATASGRPNPAQVAADLADYGYRYATGQVSPHEFWLTIATDYGQAADQAGRKYMLHVAPVLEMWNLVSTVKNNYETGLFSDCAIDKKEVIRSAYSLTDYFDYLILSCDVQLSKRDPQIYQLMLQGGKFRPEECLMIDDTVDNTVLAAEQGFATHIFTDPSTLKSYLNQLPDAQNL